MKDKAEKALVAKFLHSLKEGKLSDAKSQLAKVMNRKIQNKEFKASKEIG